MKAWITKYALTQGIFHIEAEVCISTDPTGNMISTQTYGGLKDYYHGEGVEKA
jgi:hypothetical protein